MGIRVFASRIRKPSPYGLGRKRATGAFSPLGFDPLQPEIKKAGQLTLTCNFVPGGDDGDRTHDLGVANAALSQLSYIPRWCPLRCDLLFCHAVHKCQCLASIHKKARLPEGRNSLRRLFLVEALDRRALLERLRGSELVGSKLVDDRLEQGFPVAGKLDHAGEHIHVLI